MASNITRDKIRDRIRDRTEIRSVYISDAVLNDWINDSIAALYDLLVQHEPARYRSTATITVVSGTDEYTITDDAADFYKAIGVDVADASSPTGFYTLSRFDWKERNDYAYTGDKFTTRYDIRGGKLRLHPSPNFSGSLTLHYIATAPSLADDVTNLDVVNAWHEWIVLDVAIKCAQKEESDPAVYIMERDRVTKRIVANAEIDQSEPKQVIDAYRGLRRWWRKRYYWPQGVP